MKRLLILLALPAMVYAQVPASDAKITDIWISSQKRVPIQTQVCDQVQVPIYQEAKPNGGAVLLGAIIGNAIGRAAGVDGGQTAGTLIGGIAGSEISKNNQTIDHYETRQQCRIETTYNIQNSKDYSHSVVEFIYEGKVYRIRFNK